jgi:hypothetical protein
MTLINALQLVTGPLTLVGSSTTLSETRFWRHCVMKIQTSSSERSTGCGTRRHLLAVLPRAVRAAQPHLIGLFPDATLQRVHSLAGCWLAGFEGVNSFQRNV